MTPRRAALAAGFLFASAVPALAAEGLDGRTLGLPWAIPFLGMLLSIAIFPLVASRLLAPSPLQGGGVLVAAGADPHRRDAEPRAPPARRWSTPRSMEYLPFILLLLALFTTAGGIVVRGNLHDTPLANTGLLAAGTACASVIGTTGAAMVFIRPLLRANDDRKHNAHVVIFFDFPSSSRTCWRGADATWRSAAVSGLSARRGFLLDDQVPLERNAFCLLVVLLVVSSTLSNTWMQRHVKRSCPAIPPGFSASSRDRKTVNILLLAVIIAAILFGLRDLGNVVMFGTLNHHRLLRESTLVVMSALSLAFTTAGHRAEPSSTGDRSWRWQSSSPASSLRSFRCWPC